MCLVAGVVGDVLLPHKPQGTNKYQTIVHYLSGDPQQEQLSKQAEVCRTAVANQNQRATSTIAHHRIFLSNANRPNRSSVERARQSVKRCKIAHLKRKPGRHDEQIGRILRDQPRLRDSAALSRNTHRSSGRQEEATGGAIQRDGRVRGPGATTPKLRPADEHALSKQCVGSTPGSEKEAASHLARDPCVRP